MKTTSAQIVEILGLLVETPRRISTASAKMSDYQLNHKPKEDSWSANDILAHLRACADVWGDTIKVMLAADEPTIEHLSPRAWVRETDYRRLTFPESLAAFEKQRGELLAILNRLSISGWSLGATIKGRRHTIYSQSRRLALHELTHCQQLERLQQESQHVNRQSRRSND